ncbi:SAM-dependent methyltransferase [Devosia sp. ZB163]|uniref:class I SAM-dependent methyltransferase n=1 Tax=Devosia sp. ZB163 TaxID=3025938 RepID=UPI00235FFBA7|nr:SAM-dependent methyltransferase [Devosia sp. ZB163]MDC9824434.1 SAM-dependent methyltransferase [Devosia sp. ZB163]
MDTSLPKLDQFLAAVEAATTDGSLVRLALRMPFGADETLKSVDIKPATIRDALKLSFTFHHKTRDLTQNHPPDGAIGQLKRLIEKDFRQAFLFTTGFDLAYDAQGKQPRLKQTEATSKAPATLEHDREKARPIKAVEANWLAALGVTGADGQVLKAAGDKFRQINRYVEILGPLLKAIPPDRLKRVVDMGAGKGYLTFAVADYLCQLDRQSTDVVGVEFRQDLVDFCNRTAQDSEIGNLSFAQGTIESFDSTGADALIALHACDTATDDAIAKGIAAGAELIVVAPCCHKQIRREMEAAHQGTDLDFVTRHGIFLERQAEMVTDAMRAMILEHFGYSTKVFEFISDVHTPKNVLIVGTKTRRGKDAGALKRLEAAKAYFGIRRHHLEDALGL